jgi:(2Fe-2S) ferredoxin
MNAIMSSLRECRLSGGIIPSPILADGGGSLQAGAEENPADIIPYSGARSERLASFERHLFICTNQREPGSARGCCSPDGKGELQKLFKEAIGAAGLKATVRANKAGCLDQCEHGPTVVVYPEAVWYGFVQPEDVAEIVQEHIVNGRPVERLRLAESCVNTASCPHKHFS